MKFDIDQAYSFCQIGLRSNQEDSRYPDQDIPQQGCTPFFAVCDGVGGADGGECASKAVCQALGKFMDDQDPELPFTQEDFQEGLSYVYRALYDTMREKHNFSMATTLTFLYFSASGVAMAHIGDSRIYQLRPGVGIVHRTEDHSLVNEMVRSGEILPEQAATHHLRNCITKCINFIPAGAEIPYTDLYMTRDVLPGDIFFLCTDGVLHNMTESDLVQLLCFAPGSLKEKMDMIAHESATSSDNNTAYAVQVADVKLENYEKSSELSDKQKATMALGNLGADGEGLTIEYGLTPIQPQAPKIPISERLSNLFRNKK